MKMPSTPPKMVDMMSRYGPQAFIEEQVELAKRFNSEYLHWDEVRRRDTSGYEEEAIWMIMQMTRNTESISIGGIEIRYSMINAFQEHLHRLDMISSAEFLSKKGIDPKAARAYVSSSVMEESIASSQIEGASSTRKAAKEMLREGRRPKNRSERMIVNNYRAMEAIRDMRNDELTLEMISDVHGIITNGLLDDRSYEGKFRDADDMVVQDPLSGEIFHHPPPAKELPVLMKDLCDFVNDEEHFIHPMIKGSIIHFIIAYLHPFVDGNGRLARSIFYWYALKKGYWLFEYLSISRSIKKHRGKYDLAYVLSETDDNDVTYFIRFNLKCIDEALDAFIEYMDSKIDEEREIGQMVFGNELNMRQRAMVHDAMDGRPFGLSALESKYQISYGTAYSDVQKLKEMGIIEVYGRAGNKLLFSIRKNGTEF